MANTEEPNTAPEPDRWYNITLGSTFKDNHNNHLPSPKFYTLRYEFKPASIDKSQPGLLHKSKDNKVTVEYHNNQHGKPSVSFEGVGEDYKENDAVLFFDGEAFRLERLHHAVKRLRHVRLPGESVAAPTTTLVAPPGFETYSLVVGKVGNLQPLNRGVANQMPFQAEHDIGESQGVEVKEEKSVEYTPFSPNTPTASPEPQNYESEVNVDIINDDDNGCRADNEGNACDKGLRTVLDIDINLPHQADTDDEIADVDISGDEADKGPNAAEALRAQVNAERSSSSSSSSGSDSSESEDGSGSGSSSSDSESSDGDSITSI